MKKVPSLKSSFNKEDIIDRLQAVSTMDNCSALRQSFASNSSFVPRNNPFRQNLPDEMDIKVIKSDINEIYDVIKNIKRAIFVPKIQYSKS